MTIMVVDRYVLPPGNCLVCYGSHLPAVSTGIDIHQPGQLQDAEVVICNKCVLHMAREVGKRIGYRVVADAFVDEMNATIDELHAQIVALNDERDKAYHARNALLASLGETEWVPQEQLSPSLTPTEVELITHHIAEHREMATPVEQAAAVVLQAEMVATVERADAPPPKKRTR